MIGHRLVAMIVAITVVGACSSTSSGPSESSAYFREPFPVLWEAASTALRRVGATVVGTNEQQGLVVGAYDLGSNLGKADLMIQIFRPTHGFDREGWDVQISSRPPGGAHHVENLLETMTEIEGELTIEFRKAVLSQSNAFN